jgi:hypothetical protein
MKPQLGALLLIEGFPTIPRALQEVPWFGKSEHDKQNNQLSFKDRLHKLVF